MPISGRRCDRFSDTIICICVVLFFERRSLLDDDCWIQELFYNGNFVHALPRLFHVSEVLGSATLIADALDLLFFILRDFSLAE